MTVERRGCLVGWTYRRHPMWRLFDAAREYGFASVEVRSCADAEFNTVEHVIGSLRQARELAARTNVAIAVVYLHNFVVSVPGELRRRNPLYLSPESLQAIADSGASLVHLLLERVRPDGTHVLSAAEAQEEDFAACREALETLGEALEPFGLRAAVEIRPGTIADSLEGALWTSAHLDHDTVGVSLDFANLLLSDAAIRLDEAIQALAGRIIYTHLKNVKLYPWGHDWDIALDAGSIDYFEVLSSLHRAGYAGLLGVEYCGTGDPDVFVRRDAKYLRWLDQRLERASTWQCHTSAADSSILST